MCEHVLLEEMRAGLHYTTLHYTCVGTQGEETSY